MSKLWFKYSVLIGLCLFASKVIAESNKALFIKNVRLISGTKPIVSEQKHVLIRDGRIANIYSSIQKPKLPVNTTIFNAEGQYAIPGLIDSHVHLKGIPGVKELDDLPSQTAKAALAQIPKSYLYFGFTTVVDLISQPESIRKWNQQALAPQAFYCGALTIPNGYPNHWLKPELLFSGPWADNLLFDQAQANIYPTNFDQQAHAPAQQITRFKALGAKCVKLFYEPGFGSFKNLRLPDQQLVKAVVKAAKKVGLPVFLHGNSVAAYRFGIATGVDVIVHGMWHGDLSEANEYQVLAAQLANAGIATQPTLQVIYGETELLNPQFFSMKEVLKAIPKALATWYQSDAGQWMVKQLSEMVGDTNMSYRNIKNIYKPSIQKVKNMVKAQQRAGAQLLFGSDSPSGPFYSQFPGLNGAKEIEHWVEAGIPLSTLFQALTIDNAKALGLDKDIGTIEKGKRANILLLNSNPLTSAKAYNDISHIVLAGELVLRETLSVQK